MQGIELTVSELNDYVRRCLAGDPILQHITLRGEISNFKPYASGHWYFTLKDEQSCISCVLFRQYAYGVRFTPRDGMKVLLTGSAGLYVKDGRYQFYADGMRQNGVGALYQQLLELKEKLRREGLFDVARKRPLPLLPRAVGIVTSSSGAVLHDIRTVAGRRFPGLPLVLRPAQVQGEGAAADIARGIAEAAAAGVDVLIVGRGGGSIEDLWAFNEEVVVRAVAACPVPVISAVGHETDVTLCDLAADMRAATPSQAAELAVPERDKLLASVEKLRGALRRGAENALLKRKEAFSGLLTRLANCQPRLQAQQLRMRAVQQQIRLRAALEKILQERRQRVETLSEKLGAVGPRQALRRGYTIVLRGETPALSVREAQGELTVLFYDGWARARVLESREGDPFVREEGEKLRGAPGGAGDAGAGDGGRRHAAE